MIYPSKHETETKSFTLTEVMDYKCVFMIDRDKCLIIKLRPPPNSGIHCIEVS